MLNKKYQVFLIDPPWAYQSLAHHKSKFRGGACGHYSLMTINELKHLNLQAIADENSVMFLWGTAPMLPEQIKLMEHWGWKYKTVAFVWLKLNKNKNSFFMGPGHYTRANGEFLLFGTRGKCLLPKDKSILQPVITRYETHSHKPKEIHARIDAMYPVPNKIELFATQITSGWDCFGMSIDGQDVFSYIGSL